MKSNIKWENINISQLVRHVSLVCDRKVISDEKLSDVVPTPKTKTTLNSFIAQRGTARKTNGDSQFVPAERLPDCEETKRLIGLLCSETVKTCMMSHFYTIGGDIRKQSEGGSIGSDLTGECARLVMIQWDDKLIAKLKDLGICVDMYSRYVDDMVIIMRPIGKGWQYINGSNEV